MNLADQLDFENSIGHLRAMECAIQALILTHPDPGAFGETLHSLARNAAARPEHNGNGNGHVVEASEGFRDACEAFGRAAEVAISTAARAPLGNGNGHGEPASR
jgi:hypothetical protein